MKNCCKSQPMHSSHCMLNLLNPTSFKETVQYFKSSTWDVQHVRHLTNRSKEESNDQFIGLLNNQENADCRRLTETALFNTLTIHQAKVNRKSTLGEYVQNRNKIYKDIQQSTYAGMDEISQTPPVTFNKMSTAQKTDPLVHNTESKSVDTMATTTGKIKTEAVIEQLKDRALIIERLLGLDDKCHFLNLKRKCNREEKINYMVRSKVFRGIDLDLLWTVHSAFGSVLAVSWAPGDEHHVTAAYGSHEPHTNSQRPSCVCVWNLSNRKYPERMYMFPSLVKKLEYSKWKPHLLLVLLEDGALLIVDVSLRTKLNMRNLAADTLSHIVASNSEEDRSPDVLDATWCNGRKSVLYTKQNMVLEYAFNTTLLKPNRIVHAVTNAVQIDLNLFPLLYNKIDFLHLIEENVKNSDQFYVANSRGNLYRVSNSRKETLQTYTSDALVTSFHASPHIPEIFLTTHYDGKINVWCNETNTPLLTLQRDWQPVQKAQWVPSLSTVIFSITHTELHVWNLAEIQVKPYLTLSLPSAPHKQINNFVFSNDGTTVYVGDDGGSIFVYKISTKTNLDYPEYPTEPQLHQFCRNISQDWSLTPAAADYLQTLRYPWPDTALYKYDRTAALRKDFHLIEKTYPTVVPDRLNVTSLAETLQKLFKIAVKGQNKETLKIRNKCVEDVLLKWCSKCKEDSHVSNESQ